MQEIDAGRIVNDLVGTLKQTGGSDSESTKNRSSSEGDSLGQSVRLGGGGVGSGRGGVSSLGTSDGRSETERARGRVGQFLQRLSGSMTDVLNLVVSLLGGRSSGRAEDGGGGGSEALESISGLVMSRTDGLGVNVSGRSGGTRSRSEDGRGSLSERLERTGRLVGVVCVGAVESSKGSRASGSRLMGVRRSKPFKLLAGCRLLVRVRRSESGQSSRDGSGSGSGSSDTSGTSTITERTGVVGESRSTSLNGSSGTGHELPSRGGGFQTRGESRRDSVGSISRSGRVQTG